MWQMVVSYSKRLTYSVVYTIRLKNRLHGDFYFMLYDTKS